MGSFFLGCRWFGLVCLDQNFGGNFNQQLRLLGLGCFDWALAHTDRAAWMGQIFRPTFVYGPVPAFLQQSLGCFGWAFNYTTWAAQMGRIFLIWIWINFGIIPALHSWPKFFYFVQLSLSFLFVNLWAWFIHVLLKLFFLFICKYIKLLDFFSAFELALGNPVMTISCTFFVKFNIQVGGHYLIPRP